MFKIFLYFFCLISFLQFQTAQAAKSKIENTSAIQCAAQLKGCLNKIQQLPEARQLITDIQKEGPIKITVNDNHYLSKQFGAFWDPCNRVITVNYSSHRSEGSLIGSIIFELHNASVNSKLIRLDNLAASGKIDREAYVEGVERLEYQNSLNASALTKKGIQKGIFPKSAYLPTYSTFEEHFRIQKEAGHSAFIAKNYNHLAPRKTNVRYNASGYSTSRTPSQQFKRVAG